MVIADPFPRSVQTGAIAWLKVPNSAMVGQLALQGNLTGRFLFPRLPTASGRLVRILREQTATELSSFATVLRPLDVRPSRPPLVVSALLTPSLSSSILQQSFAPGSA